jgi:hypothetical protein
MNIVSMRTELYVIDRWLDIESEEAIIYLAPAREAAEKDLPGAKEYLANLLSVLSRPKVIVELEEGESFNLFIKE